MKIATLFLVSFTVSLYPNIESFFNTSIYKKKQINYLLLSLKMSHNSSPTTHRLPYNWNLHKTDGLHHKSTQENPRSSLLKIDSNVFVRRQWFTLVPYTTIGWHNFLHHICHAGDIVAVSITEFGVSGGCRLSRNIWLFSVCRSHTDV